MAPFLKTECSNCETSLIVGQADTFKEVGEELGDETEMRLALGNVDVEGDPLVWADVHRLYTCAQCGGRGELPPSKV